MRTATLFAALMFATIILPAISVVAETAGPYQWRDAVIRQTPAKVGAAYVQIDNPTSQEDQLIGAKASWAGRVELHSVSTDEKGVMHMSPVDEINLPAKSSLVLAQGGYHLMLFDIKETPDDTKRDITLTFKKAGDIVITFQNQPLGMDVQNTFKEKLIMDHSAHEHHDGHDHHHMN
jgi:periplasmic copper chaperone A